MTRPSALAVDLKAIPDALKAERRWCLWRYKLDAKTRRRYVKMPFQPHGVFAKSDDASTWSDFKTVAAVYVTSGSYDGLGFFLGDGWGGIDLDKCRVTDDTTGVVSPITAVQSALDTLREIGVYVELSPSGTGYKVLGRSRFIGGEVKFLDGVVQTPVAWQGGRFFAITGHAMFGDPTIDISEMILKTFPRRTRHHVSGVPADVPDYITVGDRRGVQVLTEEQIVDGLMRSPQVLKFVRLCQGDKSDYGDDHSRAEQGFFSLVLYYGADIDLAEAMFRKTQLYSSDRWDDRPTYRRATLQKALAYIQER